MLHLDMSKTHSVLAKAHLYPSMSLSNCELRDTIFIKGPLQKMYFLPIRISTPKSFSSLCGHEKGK